MTSSGQLPKGHRGGICESRTYAGSEDPGSGQIAGQIAGEPELEEASDANDANEPKDVLMPNVVAPSTLAAEAIGPSIRGSQPSTDVNPRERAASTSRTDRTSGIRPSTASFCSAETLQNSIIKTCYGVALLFRSVKKGTLGSSRASARARPVSAGHRLVVERMI